MGVLLTPGGNAPISPFLPPIPPKPSTAPPGGAGDSPRLLFTNRPVSASCVFSCLPPSLATRGTQEWPPVTAPSCCASGPPESACSSHPAATAGLSYHAGGSASSGPSRGSADPPSPAAARGWSRVTPGSPASKLERSPGPRSRSPTGRPHPSCFHPQVVAPAAGHPSHPGPLASLCPPSSTWCGAFGRAFPVP